MLLVIDVYTREIIDLTAYDGWEPSSEWTMKTFSAAMSREDRKPGIVINDNGTVFHGQFERQLRVLEIDQRRTPSAVPNANGVAERAIKSVRLEILNHVRVSGVDELQWYLNEYKKYYNWVSQYFTSLCCWNYKIQLFDRWSRGVSESSSVEQVLDAVELFSFEDPRAVGQRMQRLNESPLECAA